MATIDILMPAYNAAATIEAAVESLRAQTVSDFRIIIIDDGSTDETPAILARLAALDPRLVVIRKENAGIVEARNTALSHAEAEFIACLDADDISLPNRLELTLNYLRAHPECIAVGGRVQHIDETGKPLPGVDQPADPEGARVDTIPARDPYIIHSTLMTRRAEVEAVGRYRHVPYSEDTDLFWRLGERGRLVILPEILTLYRVHTASVSSTLHNGRVMAVGCQLGARSAARRRAGRPDIAFSKAAYETLKKQPGLEQMVASVSVNFDEADEKHFRMAVAVKLMEMTRMRPFEPDRADCAYIRDAWQYAGRLDTENRNQFSWYLTVTAARLIRVGRLGDALALLPPRFLPIAFARFVKGQG
ncbi:MULTISPECIES: glycosyltransferase family 2 protein [Hyphomonas]|nr:MULTISPECIES: glycosyltransferase family 2 protein [Hyphomonas]